MFILLIGPKGSGKSHIGRVLERHLGVHFFHVEPLWIAYYVECRAAGQEPGIPEGIRIVHPRIQEALVAHEHVCVETTGASPEILNDLLSLAPAKDTLTVRLVAPLELCLERVVSRDQTRQIPMDLENIKKVHHLSTSAEIDTTLVLENLALSEAEIVSLFEGLLSGGAGSEEGEYMERPTSGPAKAGLFLYAKDLARLASFYESVLGLLRVRDTDELVVLQSPDIQLVVHAIPPLIAQTITITSPPQRRANTALKFFFTVASLAAAEETARFLGGEVDQEEWQGPGFRVRNACDPEGNVFQVREPC